MSESEILTAIKKLEERIDSLEFTVKTVVSDQNVVDDAVRRMQLEFLTINELFHKLTFNRNRPNPQT